MRGEATVFGYRGPLVIQDLYVRSPGVYHRFHGDDKTALDSFSRAGIPEVRDGRVFVHAAADAVANEGPHHRESFGFRALLDRRANVTHAVAHLELGDPPVQGVVGGLDQASPLRIDRPHRDGAGGVGAEAVLEDAEVEPDDVALGEDLVLAGDAVDDDL